MQPDLSAICKQAISIIRETGAWILQESTQFDTGRVELKGRADLVSYVDKTAEEKLVAGLKPLLPEAVFITEEGTQQTGVGEYIWIIDPLDGTTNFVHGLPPFAISVGLMQGDKTVLGIVHECRLNETFWANAATFGAFCNEEPIHVSRVPEMAGVLAATGFPYRHDGRLAKHLDVVEALLSQTHGVRRLGSAATDLAYVASGRLDAYYEYNLHPWDVCAGAFLVQKAGGTVTDFNEGSDFVFGREVVATNGKVHLPFLHEIRRHLA